ncbi:type II toxin-antitoxin system RelE/ParE family toxin [Bradyrhizobium diazoefficiens]|nr:type II toxin-antitoxin system RelE/ParE family toxin [Bradyrhizobium diazoefficiens]MBR0773123.1 type II toxin-antitoxin system RelE/ParE family toxin [Bradyrhizobium diazoefficiens]
MSGGLYGYAYSEAALKFLETAVPAKIRVQIKQRVEALTSNPTPPGCKKLHAVTDGEHPVYRVRQGDYRILYSVRGNPHQIVVLDIGHRKDIYR